MRLAGYEGNGMVCSCGDHEGVGTFPSGEKLTAGDLAARFKRLSERMSSYLLPDYRDYLLSWEAQHGPVQYAMREVGVNTGAFGNKGQPVLAPRVLGGDIGEEQQRRLTYGWNNGDFK